jgi:hypothetical protein
MGISENIARDNTRNKKPTRAIATLQGTSSLTVS